MGFRLSGHMLDMLRTNGRAALKNCHYKLLVRCSAGAILWPFSRLDGLRASPELSADLGFMNLNYPPKLPFDRLLR